MSSDIIMLDIFIPKLVNDLLSIARFPTKKFLKKSDITVLKRTVMS